jgi:uncharacterized membrane protein YhaH (DUF805 family)
MQASIRAAFDPRGRLSRRAYGRFAVRALLVSAALLCLAILLAGQGFRSAALLAFCGNLFVLIAMLAQTVRRLHDRDRSAGWLGLYALVYAASFAPVEDAAERYPLPAFAFALAILGFTLWFFAETFFRAGTRGRNRFGPEPPAQQQIRSMHSGR